MTYEFAATLHRVIDGDTAELRFDLGFHVSTVEAVRIAGIDTPELREEGGREAAEHLRSLLEGKPLFVVTEKRRSFTRYVATITVISGDGGFDVGQAMISAGHATEATA